MQNLQNTFGTRKRSFIRAFSISMTVPLITGKEQGERPCNDSELNRNANSCCMTQVETPEKFSQFCCCYGRDTRQGSLKIYVKVFLTYLLFLLLYKSDVDFYIIRFIYINVS